MNLLLFSTGRLSPSRSIRTISHLGRPPFLVAAGMRVVELLRTELSSLSPTLLDRPFRTPSLSHHRVSLSPAMPKPPPKPPDPCARPLDDSASLSDDAAFLAVVVLGSDGFLCYGGLTDADLHLTSIGLHKSWARPSQAFPNPAQQSFILWIQLIRVWPIQTIKDIFSNWLLYDPSTESFQFPYVLGVHSRLAEMLSSPSLWCMFNISTSSSGMERSLPPSFLYRERTFPHLPFFERSRLFSDPIPSKFYNILIVLSSCVVVCTGPEDATGFASLSSGGRSWFSTSHFDRD